MRRNTSAFGALLAPCATMFCKPARLLGLTHASRLIVPLMLRVAGLPRLIKSLAPSNVAPLLNLPAPPAAGQVAPEQVPLFAFPEVSANVVVPAFSFKCSTRTVLVIVAPPAG